MDPVGGTCPGDSRLVAFVEHALSDGDRDAIRVHLDDCEMCRAAIGHVVATAEPGRVIGRYRLDRELGRGGMGVVWQAWDPALERDLAIKLVHADLGRDGHARLIREARALAKLSHPNVVAVHDVGAVGTNDGMTGEVFVATELIDGEPLDRWQHDAARTHAEILDAYTQAARGLHAAHALGLVHRDVKPSNIFVARDGRVRVGDFGLARRVDAKAETEAIDPDESARVDTHMPTIDTRLTRAGAVIGTPAYMAPEQLAGATLDHRADQFALCVSITEALTGKRPAADTPASELARSNIDAPWRAIAKGLAKRPNDRHRDLEPLIAALASALVPKRRRFVIVAGGLAAVTAATGILLAGREAPSCPIRATSWTADTQLAMANAFRDTSLVFADDARRAVAEAIDARAAELAVQQQRACDAHTSPAEQTRRDACFADIISQLDQLVAALSSHPDDRVIQRAPSAARSIADPALCNQPGSLVERAVPSDPGLAAQVRALSERVSIAATQRHLGKLDAATQTVTSAMRDADTLHHLPSVAETRLELATILHAAEQPGAEPTLVAALAAASEAHADVLAARISALLVEIVGDTGDVATAERQAGLARAANLRVGVIRHLEAVIERGLGRTNQAAKRYVPALEHYRKAEEIHVQLGELDDVDFDRRAEVLALGNLDRIDEATALNAKVLASDRANLGPKHPRVIADLMSGAVIAFRAGRYPEAIAGFSEAAVIEDEVSGRNSRRAAQLHGRLAAAYMATGRLDEAEAQFKTVIRVLANKVPASDEELRGQRMNLAAVSVLLGRYAQAEAELTTLVEAARASHDDENLALILQNLAEALTRDGKHKAALVAVREAIAKDAAAFGPSSRRGAEALVTLGNVQVNLGDPAAAARAYTDAIAMFEKTINATTPELGEPLTGLAELALARHDAAAARTILVRATKLLVDADVVDLARAKFALARAHDALKDPTAALVEAHAADELYKRAGTRADRSRAAVTAWLASHPSSVPSP